MTYTTVPVDQYTHTTTFPYNGDIEFFDRACIYFKSVYGHPSPYHEINLKWKLPPTAQYYLRFEDEVSSVTVPLSKDTTTVNVYWGRYTVTLQRYENNTEHAKESNETITPMPAKRHRTVFVEPTELIDQLEDLQKDLHILCSCGNMFYSRKKLWKGVHFISGMEDIFKVHFDLGIMQELERILIGYREDRSRELELYEAAGYFTFPREKMKQISHSDAIKKIFFDGSEDEIVALLSSKVPGMTEAAISILSRQKPLRANYPQYCHKLPPEVVLAISVEFSKT